MNIAIDWPAKPSKEMLQEMENSRQKWDEHRNNE
jgi:hypothetical protein